MEAKDALGIKRADLVQLWTRSQMLEEMIKLLDQMFVYLLYRLFSLLNTRFCFQRKSQSSARCAGNSHFGEALPSSLCSFSTKSEDNQ
jgi:hypothetical protein